MICLLKIALPHSLAKSAKEMGTRGLQGKSFTRLVSTFVVDGPAEIQRAAVGAAHWEDVLLKGYQRGWRDAIILAVSGTGRVE